uniref:Uncharacterized protein n=1 Tax=Strigamia maritima TaxID=126957 RepID=T1JBS8_STRMM
MRRSMPLTAGGGLVVVRPARACQQQAVLARPTCDSSQERCARRLPRDGNEGSGFITAKFLHELQPSQPSEVLVSYTPRGSGHCTEGS